MTQTYETDAYRRQLETEVVSSGGDPRPWVALTDTVLYPEGGGQPSDHGWVGERRVLDVQKSEGLVRHFLDGPAPAGRVSVRLDWERRFDHMQQHTAQHLLTALAADRYGWQTTSFHLGEQRSDIELDVADPPSGKLAELEELAAAEIRASRPVTARFVSPAQFEALEVRTRGLPQGHRGDVRLVEIEGVDCNTCGGTHVANTAHLETVKLLGRESLRGGTRLFLVAGGRVRLLLAAHEARSAELRSLLGTSDAELPEAVQSRLDQLREAGRKLRGLEEELAEARAELLLQQEGPVLAAHFDGRELGFLQRLGRRVVAENAKAVVFLTSRLEGKEGVFLLAAGSGSGVDLATAGPRVAKLLEGRGGGSGGVFQGRAADLTAREEALAVARASCP